MTCNACGSKELNNYFKHKDVNLLRCAQCGLIFMEKILPANLIAEYYQGSFYDKEESERFAALFEALLRSSRFLRVKVIEDFCEKPGIMIDVGFSRGTTMSLLKAKGWRTFGTQISVNSYEHAKKNGLDVFLGDLDSAKMSSQSVDLITFWNVLEHINNPERYLKESNRLLKEGGKLIIELPNIGSPIAKIFKDKWFGFDIPRHIYHFSAKSLNLILEKNGFRVLKRKYFSVEHSVFSLLQSVLNLFNFQNNVLFESIKKNKNISFFAVFYNWLLAFIFIVPCIIASYVLSLFNAGDIMRVYCVKSRSI